MTVQSTFTFRAREAGGAIVTGSMVAASADEVGSRLRAEGKYVLSVEDSLHRREVTLDAAQVRRNQAARGVKRVDVIAFCQQMSIMLETGVPMSEAMDAFCRQTRRREFLVVLEVVRDDIYGGQTMSSALAKWPRVFPRLMVSLVKASEASGTMAMMLGRIGEYLMKERRTIKQIKGALSYPLFMMAAGLVLTVFLMVFILPRFALIYERRSATLPTPTRILLGLSDFLTQHYLIYGPVLAILVIAWLVFIRHPTGRWFTDWLRLNVPVLRTMFGQVYITRFARTMATLLNAGVNLLDIIDICRGVTNNRCYDELWRRMEDGVREGQQISDAVARFKYIPPNVASMVSSGERSGKLGTVMERLAEFSEEELDGAVRQVTSFVEPIMIICMGVMVGGIAMALLLPIFKMGNVLS